MCKANLFEYNLPPSSWEGEPAPSLALLEALLTPPGLPNGDRIGLFIVGSIGEVSAVDDPDLDWVAES